MSAERLAKGSRTSYATRTKPRKLLDGMQYPQYPCVSCTAAVVVVVVVVVVFP
jgi:hypothetical protein